MANFNQELKFPVQWHYKIIGDKANSALADEIVKVLRRNGFSEIPEVGSESSGGKYRSWHVSLTFHDRETMRSLGEQLEAVPGVKFIL